jgi:hypothetical protein
MWPIFGSQIGHVGFERVPAGGDAYLLSHIIHDWNEEQCLTILGHCCGLGGAGLWPGPGLRIGHSVNPQHPANPERFSVGDAAQRR